VRRLDLELKETEIKERRFRSRIEEAKAKSLTPEKKVDRQDTPAGLTVVATAGSHLNAEQEIHPRRRRKTAAPLI